MLKILSNILIFAHLAEAASPALSKSIRRESADGEEEVRQVMRLNEDQFDTNYESNLVSSDEEGMAGEVSGEEDMMLELERGNTENILAAIRGYANGTETGPITPELYIRILENVESCNLSEEEAENLAYSLLHRGIWFEPHADSIEKAPLGRVSGKTKSEYGKKLIVELLRSWERYIWIYDNKLVVSTVQLARYYHLGKLCIHPLPMHRRHSDKQEENAERKTFEHVILLYPYDNDDNAISIRDRRLLLYFISYLRDGTHILPADYEKWCDAWCDGVQFVRNSRIGGVTDIVPSSKLWRSNKFANAIRNAEYLELGFNGQNENLITSLIKFVSFARPKRVRYIVGKSVHNRLLEILRVPNGTEIVDLRIESIGDLFDANSANPEWFQEFSACKHVKGLTVEFSRKEAIPKMVDLIPLIGLIENLDFLKIRCNECSKEVFEAILRSSIRVLIFDCQELESANMGVEVLDRLFTMKSLEVLIVVSSAKQHHGDYLLKIVRNIKEPDAKRIYIVEKRSNTNDDSEQYQSVYAYSELYPREEWISDIFTS